MIDNPKRPSRRNFLASAGAVTFAAAIPASATEASDMQTPTLVTGNGEWTYALTQNCVLLSSEQGFCEDIGR